MTSDPVEQQNCIGFAAGDDMRWWWPVEGFPGKFPPPFFWPKQCDLKESVETFITAFALVGFEKCDENETGALENGVEKIAIFAKSYGKSQKPEPTHAAIQSPSRNGKWRSKMGEDEDIEHALDVLKGRLYGDVVCFMKRTIADKKEAKKKLRRRAIPSH